MIDYPTLWQRKMIWAALTAFCVVLLIVIVGTVIWAGANVISFLQPILIPVAIAVLLVLVGGTIAAVIMFSGKKTESVASAPENRNNSGAPQNNNPTNRPPVDNPNPPVDPAGPGPGARRPR